MNAVQQGFGDDYRRSGRKVEVTQADGSTIIGSCRWEDSYGVKVDVPGRDTATYHAREFVTFVDESAAIPEFETVVAEAKLREDYPSIFGPRG